MYHQCERDDITESIESENTSYPSMFLVERGNDEQPMSGKLHQEVMDDSRWGHVVSLRTAPSRYHQIVVSMLLVLHTAMLIQGMYSSSLKRKEIR